MKLNTKMVRGIPVVNVRGQLIGGPENADNFHNLFKDLIKDGHKHVVVNMKSTSWANSQGIGMLIRAYTSLTQTGGDLVLAHVVKRTRDVLTVTKLLLIFKDFDTVDESVDYLLAKNPEAATG
jgi:anti-sigma B factor antagonist